MRTVFLTSCLWLAAVLVAGCGPPAPPKPDAAPVDVIEHFRATQATTLTPHGTVVLDSVERLDGSRLRYETSDGAVIEVDYQPNGVGGFTYSHPRRLDE